MWLDRCKCSQRFEKHLLEACSLSLFSLSCALFLAGHQLLRAKAQTLRESVYPYILFLGLLHPQRSHTLCRNCLPDTKKKNHVQLHPCLPLLSLPHPELWTPVQFYIESITILFNLFFLIKNTIALAMF